MNSTPSQKDDIVKTLILKSKLLRLLLPLVVALGLPLLAKATHIVGGEISYRCLGNNEYEIILKVYRDCTRGTEEVYDNPGYIGIYDVTGTVFIRSLEVRPGKISQLNPIVDACFVEPGNKCVDTTTYIARTVLDPNPPNGGYLFTYVRCCRNADITNIENPLQTGAVYQIELKQEAMLRCNSSPTFVNFPPNFLCVNRPWRFDHAARDLDGDSLAYRLCTPIQGGSFVNNRPIPPRNPPPFDSIIWRNGYGLDQMFGAGDAPLRIDPVTGLLTATPEIQGQFVVGVCVLEYDRVTKRLLSETRRDFQYNLIACSDPTANLRDTVYICQGNRVALNPDFANMSGVSYRWSPGNLVSDSTAANPIFIGNQTTVFTVNVIKGSCASTRTVVASVRPNPIVDLLPNQSSICVGDSLTLRANGTGGTAPLTYTWSGGLSSNPVQVVKPTFNTKYFVTVTDFNGCSAKDSVNVIVSPPPTIRITTGEKTICAGDSVRLSVEISGGATPYILVWNLPGVVGPNPVVRPNTTTTYVVTVVGGNGCSATAQVTITVRPRPNVELGAAQAICLGDTVTLRATTTSGTPPYAYAWNRGSGQTQRVNPVLSTLYIVTVTDANGCSDVDSIEVNVNSKPGLVLGADDNFICVGESTTLRAKVNTATPPLTFIWNSPFRNDSIRVVSPTQTTTYSVTVTDKNGCAANDDIVVNVSTPPTLRLDTAFCVLNLNTYQANITTNADTVRTTAGTVVNNGAGKYSIINIPLGQNITVTAISRGSGCSTILQVQATPCCPNPPAPPISDGDKGVCFGSPFPALTARVPSGQTIDWFNTPTGGTPIVQGAISFVPTQVGTYYAQARDLATGCTSLSRTAIGLKVNSLPTAQASANLTTVCPGDSVQLTANATGGTAPYEFVWNEGLGSGSNRTATPAVSTTYIVTATDANGCFDTAQVSVKVDAIPFIDSIITSCATDLLSYSVRIFTNGNIVIANVGTVTNLGNGRFEISKIPITQDLVLIATFNPTGCGRRAFVNKPNCQCPTVNSTISGGDKTICAGQPISTLTVTVASGQTADWYDAPIGGTLLLQGSTSFTPTRAGTYYATARDLVTNCTSAVRTAVKLIENPAPSLKVMASQSSICVGQTTNLSATVSNGTAPFRFSWNQNVGNGQNQTVKPGQTTIYTVTVIDTLGCSAKDSIKITVNAPPVITVDADKTTICLGDTATLIATARDSSASFTFGWNQGLGDGATKKVNPTQTTTYSVTVTNASGCKDTADITIKVNPKPVITAKAGRSTICAGDTTSLTASATGTAPFTFAWNQGLGEGANKVVNPTQTTTYTVTVTDGNGCKNIAQVTVNVTQGLDVNLTANDDTICRGESATLRATSSNGMRPFTYTWNQGLSADSVQTVRPTQTTNYIVNVRDVNGCVGADTITVTVNEPPIVTATANQTTICPGDTARLTASATGTGPFTFAWNQGLGTGANKVVNPTQTITYAVVATDTKGCLDTTEITINVRQKPEVTLTPGRATICAGDTTLLRTTVSGGTAPYTFRWTPNTITSVTQVINPAQTTTYSVTVTDANGCRDTAQITINVTPGLNVSLSANDQTLCPGESATLTASSSNGARPFRYTWNPSASLTDSAVTVRPSQATTYAVTITDANGCTGSAQITITVNPNPNVDAVAARMIICAGDSTRLSANPTDGRTPYTFTWSPGGITGQNPIVRPTEITTYRVTVTDANGCTATDSVRVNVNPTPIANASASNSAICLGDSTVLVAGGRGGLPPYTFEWNQGIGSGQPKTVRPTQTTTYTVTVTDANNCFGTANVTVTVNPPPTVTLSATNSTICVGDSTNITATVTGGNGPFTFNWSGGLTGNPVRVSPAQTTTYTVTVTSAGNCKATAQITITVRPQPTLTATANKDTVCAGDPVVLTANAVGGAGNFTFNWSNGGTGNPITVNPTQTTVYTVIVTDGSNCRDTAQVRIFVNPRPTVNAGSDTLSCSGSPVTLTAVANSGTPGYIFNWDQGLGIGATKTVIPRQPTTYSVTVTDSKGCTSNDQVSVDVFPLPSDLPSDSITACAGVANPVATNIIPRATYQWTPAGILNNPNLPNPSVTVNRDTILFVTITYRNTCVVRDTVKVKVPPRINLQASNDTTLCVAGNFTLRATSSVANTNFVWSANRTFQPPLSTGSSIVVTPVGNVTYYVRATDTNGCSETDSVNIRSFPIQASITPETVLCEPTNQTRLTVTNQGAGQNLTYNWNPKNAIISRPDSASVLVNPNLASDYSVQLQNQFGCRDTLETKVTIVNLSGLDARVDPDTIFVGDSARLSVFLPVPCPDCSYQWSPPNSLSNPNIANPIAKPTETTAYRVVVSKAQCRAEDVVGLVVLQVICDKLHIYLPSAFTPNNDGANDVWRLRSNFNNELEVVVLVYNRWGQKVFESTDPNFTWDGTYNDRNLPPDVYGYRVEVTCPGNRKLILQGNVTLLR